MIYEAERKELRAVDIYRLYLLKKNSLEKYAGKQLSAGAQKKRDTSQLACLEIILRCKCWPITHLPVYIAAEREIIMYS
jgi:hypothetical protein